MGKKKRINKEQKAIASFEERLKNHIGFEERFQLWLWQVFVIEEHYSKEQLQMFMDQAVDRMYLFEEFVQTEFLAGYTEEFVKKQLEQFSESMTD